jgi:PAS domain S-box-containing protein
MISFFLKLFDTGDFMPRWHCGRWTEAHGWLHIVSDLAVWSAYFAIPLILVLFAARKPDLPFRKVFLLFGTFILACGTTHLMEAVIFWWPAYRLAGVIKLVTAVVSWATVVALIPIVPRALSMRSPEDLEREVRRQTAELNEANEALRREIAERERIASSLRDQREWLRVTLASIGDAVIATDDAGRVTFLNSSAEYLTGWSQVDASGRDLETVFHIVREDTDERVENPVVRVLRENVVVGLANHTHLIHRDGRRIPIDDSAAPIRATDGQIRGVVLVFHDVTERRRGERRTQLLTGAGETLSALGDVENRLQTVAQLAVGSFADGCLIELTEETLGTPTVVAAHADAAREPQLRQLARSAAPPDATAQESAHSTGNEGATLLGDPAAMTGRLALAPPQQAPLQALQPRSMIHVPLTFQNRRFGSLVLLASDGKPPYDADDLEVAEALGQRIANAVENLRLQEELRDADRRKDEFLAMLSHELRNPLAPIRNALALLNTEQVDEATRRKLGTIMEGQVKHIVRLVDDLLDVSRIMRGKIVLQQETVPVADFIDRAVQTIKPLIDDNGQQLELVPSPAAPIVQADAVRLCQVISNLLHNASKYSPTGSTIRVVTEVAGDEALIRVQDEGMGIEPRLLPHVFDLFTQSERSIERAAGGLGIGLTVARSIVELHGGTIEAHSAGPERGSEFVVHLKLAAAAARPETTKWRPVPTQPLRVLVVEDNLDSATTLEIMLSTFWGHQVEVAHDGLTGLARTAVWKPDVVLLDIGLPGLDGYQTARRIRDNPETAEITLIAISGYGQLEDREKTRDAGFDDHLVKPVSAEALEAILSRVQPQSA